MTAGRYLGLPRAASAHVAMLLAIPAILGAGTLTSLDLLSSGNASLSWYAGLAVLLSFGFALLAIWGMMTWLKRASFMVFVIYRIALSAALFAWILLA